MVTKTANDLQKSISTLNEIINRCYMKINIKKIKIMTVRKESKTLIVNIQLDNKIIEQIYQYKYLKKTLTSDSRYSIELRH